MTAQNIYTNVLTPLSVIIPSGQSSSSQINCAQLPGIACAAFRRIVFPTTFPAGTVTFKLDANDSIHTISDGTTTSIFQLVANGSQLQSITFPAIYFDSVTIFRVVSSNPMSVNTTITLYFQPIYQAVA